MAASTTTTIRSLGYTPPIRATGRHSIRWTFRLTVV
jgi:hypothetical protein